MTKKGHQKFSALKWKFLPKKVILKLWSAKFFPVPPKSAPSLRLWSWVLKVQQTEVRSIGFRDHTWNFYLIYTISLRQTSHHFGKCSHLIFMYYIRYISWSLNDPPHPKI